MKTLLLLLSGMILVASCTKMRTGGDFPGLEPQDSVDLSASRIAWLEQVAKEKADSMRIVDSLIRAGGGVDTNSLFYKKNIIIGFVEVNNRYFPNVACYIDENGKPVIDLAMIFAPNINIDANTGKAKITYNTQTAAVLNRGFSRLVQTKGVKAGMCILGNHDDAGFRNFRNLAEATAFAQHVASEVRKYDLDAIGADDEYSNTPSWANDSSFVMVMSEIKRLLPDKLVFAYIFGGASSSRWNGKGMGDVVDVGSTAFYPQHPSTSYESPTGMHFKKSQLLASSSQSYGGFSDVAGECAALKAGGYKGMMLYDIRGIPAMQTFLAPYVTHLKGKTLSVVPGCLNPTENDLVNVQ